MSCGHQEDDAQRIFSAMANLQARGSDRSFVVFVAFPGERSVQFFTLGGKVYFDIPVRAELKRKYTPEPMPSDSIADSTVYRNYLTAEELTRVNRILSSFRLMPSLDRESFIDPSIIPWDTTGWMWRQDGPFTISLDSTAIFLDSMFAGVWALKKGDYRINIQTENSPVR